MMQTSVSNGTFVSDKGADGTAGTGAFV
jgi:hypothetical protein